MALEVTFCKKHVKSIILVFRNSEHYNKREELLACEECKFSLDQYNATVHYNDEIIWIRGDTGLCPYFSKGWSDEDENKDTINPCNYCRTLKMINDTMEKS